MLPCPRTQHFSQAHSQRKHSGRAIIFGFPINLENKSEEEKPPAQQDLANVNGAEHKATGIHLVESQSGNRDWELFAADAEGSQGHGKWELKDVRVLFYSKDIVQFTVTGKEGAIDMKSKDMNIVGDVKVVSSNGYRFQTSSVNYVASERVLRSPDKIKMMGPADVKGKSIVLTGGQMIAHVDQNTMKISDQVHAEKQLENGKNFAINSKGAEFSGSDYSAQFFD